MRFLLNVGKSVAKKSKPTTSVVAVAADKVFPTSWSATNTKQQKTSSSKKKAWGQQCSPNCGCVLRFETKLDDDQTEVLGASYHAKQVVTHCVDGQLVPVSTMRDGQPLLKDCQCTSLHTLAKKVVKKLTSEGKTWSRIQNSFEVTGLRSSLALQHAILRTHNLNPKKDGNCFDLVEEALVRMVREQPLKPRKDSKNSFSDLVRAYYSTFGSSSPYSFAQETTIRFDDPSFQDEETVTRYGRALRRIQRARAVQQQKQQGKDRGLSMAASPRTLSALHMFDLSQDPADMLQEYEEHAAQQQNLPKPNVPSIDWEQYVDEMNRTEEQEKTA